MQHKGGHSYDPTTGLFTCLADGLYLFCLKAMTSNGKMYGLAVSKEDMIIFVVHAFRHLCGFGMGLAMTHCKRSQVIKVQVTHTEQGFAVLKSGRYSNFVGTLLHQDRATTKQVRAAYKDSKTPLYLLFA